MFLKVVMLHIKLEGNGTKGTMQAHILSVHTPSAPGAGSKVKTFLNIVMLHIKLKGMEHRAPYKPIFSPYIHPQPKVKISDCGHVAYQIKEKKEV